MVVIGLIAAVTSTFDTYLVVAAQTWVIDSREARLTGKTLADLEQDPSGPYLMRFLRMAVVLIFFAAAFLAFPLLAFLSDVYAAIYLFFSGMLVLAGLICGAFCIKGRRRASLGPAARLALRAGMWYVVLTNVAIILLLELTLRGMVSGEAWYASAGNWYYAVYINPVIAMFLTWIVFAGGARREQQRVA